VRGLLPRITFNPSATRFKEPGTPVANGGAVVKQLFPGARITQTTRPAGSALGQKNPGSYHVGTNAAVDIAPIPGMTFPEYVASIQSAGYRVIEGRDEVNDPVSYATGPHWHVVIGRG
jgi:soluble lytic murein transglycosylase